MIIAVGLYSVVWGKTKDHTLTHENGKPQELPTVMNHNATTKSAILEDDVITGPTARINKPM